MQPSFPRMPCALTQSMLMHWLQSIYFKTFTYCHGSPFALTRPFFPLTSCFVCVSAKLCPFLLFLVRRMPAYDDECQRCDVHWACVYLDVQDLRLQNPYPLSQSLWCTNSLPRHSTPRPRPGGNTIRVSRPWVWWVRAAKVTIWCPKGQWDPTAPRSKVGGQPHLLFHIENMVLCLCICCVWMQLFGKRSV